MVTVRLPDVVIDNGSSPFQLVHLDGFTNSTGTRLDNEPREVGHGDWGQADMYQDARYITVEGEYLGQPGVDLFSAGDPLKALHGRTFEAEFDTGARTFRTSVVLASSVKWDVGRSPWGGSVPFEFTLKADDPRLYGPRVVQTVGVPTPGVGIADPLADPVAEGAPGNLGRIVCVNDGTAATHPIVTIYGGVSEGFELLCVEHARVVQVTRPIPDGSYVTVDMGSGEVWIDGQSILPATYVPVAEWFQVGPGESCTIQWTPHGTQSGTPRMQVEYAEASL